MRVKKVDAKVKGIELPSPIFDARSSIVKRYSVLARIETEDGLVGWGEAAAFGGSHNLVGQAVRELGEHIVGECVHPREFARSLLRQTAHYGQTGVVVSAISGLEIALWDLWGLITGRSVSEMLGSSNRPVRWNNKT